jgi:Glycine-zipper domain
MMSCKQSLLFMALAIFNITVIAASDIYIYPNKGQSPQQQSQDRYECHVWAAQQSGFDPSAYHATSPAPVYVASASGGHYPRRHDLDPISGAAGGAALGALGGAIGGDAGKGAAIGAGVGALAGILNSAGNHQKKKDQQARILAQQAAQQSQQAANMEQDQANYKRAISACLEAHDYTVR